jgi:uncharacterized membrane protein YhiD involved in acid resistance
MSNTTSSSNSGGIGFLGALAILFIALKLTGYIGWSWWWVLAPLWLPVSILAFIAVVFGGMALLVRWLETPEERKLRDARRTLQNFANKYSRR